MTACALSSEKWRPGEPVAVFIKGTDSDDDRMTGLSPVRGMTIWSKLPGPALEAFKRAGLTPGEDYLLPDLGDRSEKSAKTGK